MKMKKTLVFLMNLFFIFLFIWAVSKADLNIFLQNLRIIGFLGFLFILILFSFSYLIKAFRFKCLIKDLSFKEIFTVTVYQNFFIFLLPLRSGELTYIKKLKEHNIHWKKSLKDLIFIKLNDILVLSILAIFIFLFIDKTFSKYYFLVFLIIPLMLLLIFLFDKFFVVEEMNFTKKIKIFLISIFVWISSFLPWVFILSKFLDLNFFKIIFVIGLVLVSTLFPINPPAGIGLVNGVWSLGLILVGVEKSLAINFGIFAYSIYVFQIFFLFLIVKIIEIFQAYKKRISVKKINR